MSETTDRVDKLDDKLDKTKEVLENKIDDVKDIVNEAKTEQKVGQAKLETRLDASEKASEKQFRYMVGLLLILGGGANYKNVKDIISPGDAQAATPVVEISATGH